MFFFFLVFSFLFFFCLFTFSISSLMCSRTVGASNATVL